MKRIVIVGGGMSGLAAAESVTRHAPTVGVTLLESSTRLGGHVRTECSDGFVIEAGPDVILASKPAALELARRVGLGDRIQGTNPAVRGSYIFRNGSLVRIPDGITGLVPSRMTPFVTTPLLSPLGKLRVGLDVLIPARRPPTDESIEGFVVRRLGRQMYERLAEPLLSGISAGDGSRLSMQAMFPTLFDYERQHGGLVRGMLAERRARRDRPKRTSHGNGSSGPTVSGGVTSGFLSFTNGLEELPLAIERALRQSDPSGQRMSIRTRACVEALRQQSSTRFVVRLSTGDEIAADAIILAVPAFTAASLLRPMGRELADRLDEIEYTSTVTISVAYRAIDVPRPLDATGYIVPRGEGRPVLACTWTSAKFTGRAPEGSALFRVFLGGVGRGSFVDRTDAELLEIVRNEMRDVMGVTADPTLVRINRFDRALPQYNVGHLDRIAGIHAAVEGLPGIALAGSVYGGVGIPDCVRSGEAAAVRVAHHLSS
jgi:protoporphyrinogen/coproporphyrinogen III oxidase